jgi:hypothetical protein
MAHGLNYFLILQEIFDLLHFVNNYLFSYIEIFISAKSLRYNHQKIGYLKEQVLWTVRG